MAEAVDADNNMTCNEEKFDLPHVCRTCLATPGTPALRPIFEEPSLLAMIASCTHLEIDETDGLPINICLECVKSATLAFTFQQKAEKADAKLRDYIFKRNPEIILQPQIKYELSHNETSDFLDSKLNIDKTYPCDNENADDDDDGVFHDDSNDSEDDFKPLKDLKTAKDKLKISNVDCKDYAKNDICCKVCNQRFSDNNQLKKHSEKCQIGYVQCNVCFRAFTKVSYLERHKIAAHSKIVTKNKSDGSYLCKICGFYFKRQDQLITHVTLSHNEKCGPKKRGRPSKKDILEKKLRLKNILNSMKIKTENNGDHLDENNENEYHNFNHSVDNTIIMNPLINKMDTTNDENSMKKENYYCDTCCKSFSTYEMFDNHMKEHGEVTCICKICNQHFANKDILKNHLKTHEDLVEIMNMTEKFKLDLLEGHREIMNLDRDCIKNDILTTIILNDLKTMKYDRYITELKLDFDDSMLLADGCENLDLELDSSMNIVEKMSKSGSNRKMKKKFRFHKCYLCDQVYTRTNQIFKHMAVHNYEYPFVCSTCNKVFPNEEMFNKHKKFQCDNSSKHFQCGSCEMKFRYETSLNKHILKHHKNESVSVKYLDSPHKKEKTFVCLVCNKGFYRQEHLDKHVRIHQPAEKHFECPICQKKFNRKDNLRSHSRVHEPNKDDLDSNCLCVYCGRFFSNSSNLIVHMRRHTGEKPYKCDICNKGFPRSSDLQCHRRTHTGEKPCTCTICGKGFSRSNKLARHMRIHTGQRPYKCHFCERAFTQSNDLTLHVRRHTGDKPYVCGICGDRFIQGTALQVHRRMQGHYEQVNQPVPFAANSINNPSRDKGPHRVARIGVPYVKAEDIVQTEVVSSIPMPADSTTLISNSNAMKLSGRNNFIPNNVTNFLPAHNILMQNLDVTNAVSNLPLFAISEYNQGFN